MGMDAPLFNGDAFAAGIAQTLCLAASALMRASVRDLLLTVGRTETAIRYAYIV